MNTTIVPSVLKFALIAMTFAPQVVSAEPFRHKFNELREYNKHWLAVCPDAFDPNSNSQYYRECWTSTYSGSGGFFLKNRLSVSRDRVTGKHAIRVVLDDYETVKAAGKITLKFSTGPVYDLLFGNALHGNSFVQNGNTVNEFVFDAKVTNKLLATMKQSNRMEISYKATSKTVRLPYSMIGLRSALKFTERYALPAG